MKLIYHDETIPPTYEQIYKGCQQGYGIKNPDRVSGFMSFFYRLPDVYAYGELEKLAANNEKVTDELKNFVERFITGDYGFVTNGEYGDNLENKWICGTAWGSIGRYSFSDKELNRYGGIVLEFFEDFGLLYSIEEDMSSIYAEQYNDPGYEYQIKYISFQDLVKRRDERSSKR